MSKIKSSGRKSFSVSSTVHQDAESINLSRLVAEKKFAELELAARRVVNAKPNHGFAMKALGFALLGLHRYEEALPLLRHLSALNPHDPELHHNLGIALSQLMYWDESLTEFGYALEGMPKDPEVHKDVGFALFRMQRWNDAANVLLKAIELYDGDYIEAVGLLASCLLNANRVEEAWICFNELHQAEPDDVPTLCQLISSSLRCCNWDELDSLMSQLRTLSVGLQACAVSPFALAAFPNISQAEFYDVARNHAVASVPTSVLSAPESLPELNPSGRRLRIGYLSGDLRRHPVGFIIPEVVENHDRSRFEIFAYSTRAAEPDDPVRQRLENAFEHFNEVGDLLVRRLSERIRADGIDVLVDLAGWTAHGRPEVMALRSAPVQVNWLGYAGTMGHSRLADYIIGDPVVTPLEHAPFYTEAIAQLPGCYLPVDTTRKAATRPSRAAAGLPESKFVFCSLNNSYKYNPDVFDLWASILREAPDSVLWLSHFNDSVAGRLRAEIEKRGIAPERLLFAQYVASTEEHLARLELADLALDTFPYNSHSTGVDALSAGVPLISMAGTLFASRVGASLANAAGLGELVVADRNAYRALALDLYHDRARLAELRQRVQTRQVPLFDMARFARDLESLYMRMVDDKANGIVLPLAAASM